MPRAQRKIDARSVIHQVRSNGFILELDESDKPFVHPLKKLTPEQRELLKLHRELIREELLREKRDRCWLTPFDEPGWIELMDWWMTWEPPEQGYELESVMNGELMADGSLFVKERVKVEIKSPRESWSVAVEMIREKKCVGLVELSMYFWVRAHWQKFGPRK